MLAPTRGTDGAGGRHFWLWFLPWCCSAHWSWQHSTSLPNTATGTGGTRSHWGCPRDSRAAVWWCIVASKPFAGTVWKNRVVPDCLACSVCFPFFFSFFFSPTSVGGGFLLGSFPTSMLQGKGVWSCAAGAAWLPSSAHEGFFLGVTPSIPSNIILQPSLPSQGCWLASATQAGPRLSLSPSLLQYMLKSSYPYPKG